MNSDSKIHESVGECFRPELLQEARDKSLRVISEVSALVRPGMTESDVKKLVQKVQAKLGSSKSWHPAQIRFGENTVLPFGEKGHGNVTLKEDDLYFIDIGPIFEGHEGDVGRSFAFGSNIEKRKCCEDVEAIWHEVRNHWAENPVTGEELYRFAGLCADKRGWQLSLQGANGHRISDFPHAAGLRGSVEGFKEKPAPNRWILEIQIRHPEKTFGAFFEDLLN